MADLIKPEQVSQPPQSYQPRPAGWPFERPDEEQTDLRRYYQFALKRKWLIVAIIFTGMAGVSIQTFRQTPLYKSTATIQIDPEPINILSNRLELYETSAIMATALMEPYLRTKYNILQGRALANRVVKRLNLADDPVFYAAAAPGVLAQLSSIKSFVKNWLSGNQSKPKSSPPVARPRNLNREAATADRLRANLEIKLVEGTRLVEASYISHSPQLAAKVVNMLAEEAVEENFEMQYEATRRASNFLQKQLLEMKIKVEKSEEELMNYARANRLFDVAEGEGIILQKISALSRELTVAEAQLIAQAALNEVARNASLDDFPHSLKTGAILKMENDLFQLEQKLGALSVQFGPGWPEVVQVQEQLSRLKTELTREKKQAVDQAKFGHREVSERIRMLSIAIEEQRRLADRIKQDSIQYNILKREVDTNNQLYNALLQRLKEAGISAGLKSSNIHIVDRGEVPRSVYLPDTKLNLILGLAVSLLFALGLAFVVEFLDNTVKTPDDIEQLLTLPSLGVIPVIEGMLAPAERKLLAKRQHEGETLALSSIEARSRIWEGYRSLRTSILLSHSGRPPQKILITSALQGEGKTTTANNLAIVLAQTGARTLIVDLDMRQPAVARFFGINGDEGMSNFLSGNSDLSSQIRQTHVPNLFFLPAGTIPPNPAELIGSERMENALGLLSEYFKYIVIDTPPILSVTDSLVIASRVDGVVMVIQGGKTPREAVKKAIARLSGVGAKILGALVNNVDIQKSEYAYYYRYYYSHYDYYASDSSKEA